MCCRRWRGTIPLVVAIAGSIVYAAAGAQAQTPPANTLEAVFGAGSVLGFAAMRAACAPAEAPLPAATAGQIALDLDTARAWAAQAPCWAIDAVRFDEVRASLPGTRADAAAAGLARLYADAGQQLGQSACRAGSLAGSSLESFFVASVQMGLATARAACVPAAPPLSPAWALQIRFDIEAVRQGLAALGGCISSAGADGRLASADERLGVTSASGTSADLLAAFDDIRAALRASPCGATPTTTAPAAGTSATSCEACAKQYCPACANTVILLCDALGNPACQACLDQNCRK